ncbi:hypothetical protein [Mycobacterium leprae]|uniref:hypothetical protein n=1 Tax=Mycobacterium leprae TaxID=1769 RepID=UPI0002EDA1FC
MLSYPGAVMDKVDRDVLHVSSATEDAIDTQVIGMRTGQSGVPGSRLRRPVEAFPPQDYTLAR